MPIMFTSFRLYTLPKTLICNVNILKHWKLQFCYCTVWTVPFVSVSKVIITGSEVCKCKFLAVSCAKYSKPAFDKAKTWALIQWTSHGHESQSFITHNPVHFTYTKEQLWLLQVSFNLQWSEGLKDTTLPLPRGPEPIWRSRAAFLLVHVENTMAPGAGVVGVFEVLEEEGDQTATEHQPGNKTSKFVSSQLSELRLGKLMLICKQFHFAGLHIRRLISVVW